MGPFNYVRPKYEEAHRIASFILKNPGRQSYVFQRPEVSSIGMWRDPSTASSETVRLTQEEHTPETALKLLFAETEELKENFLHMLSEVVKTLALPDGVNVKEDLDRMIWEMVRNGIIRAHNFR